MTAVAALAIAVVSAMPSLGAMRPESSSRPHLSVIESGRPLVAASGMAPGAATRRKVSIVNRGTNSGTLWLSVTSGGRRDPRGPHLEDVLLATVTDAEGRVLAVSTLATFGSRAIERLPAGAARELTVTVSLPADVDAQYAGSDAAFDLAWTLDG